MRHSIVLQATALALVLGWTQSQAAEGKYPAAHFEPEVVYQAADAAPAATPAATDGDFPAAYFEPEVVYQDPALIEATRAQPVQTPVAAPAEPARPRVAAGPKMPSPGGPVSDVSPPYGMLAFVLGIIGLAFWWSSRERAPEAEAPAPEGGEAAAEPEASAANDDTEEEAEELEALAEAAEASLAHNNRQRANKTRRVRRR